MTRFKNQGFKNTFRNARKGMRLSIKSEPNIRIHLFVGALVVATGICLHFSIIKFCILMLTIGSVISAEMFNSALEFGLDAMYHNKYSRIVGIAKDIAAGSVMITTIIAIMIGTMLFVPPIIQIITNI